MKKLTLSALIALGSLFALVPANVNAWFGRGCCGSSCGTSSCCAPKPSCKSTCCEKPCRPVCKVAYKQCVPSCNKYRCPEGYTEQNGKCVRPRQVTVYDCVPHECYQVCPPETMQDENGQCYVMKERCVRACKQVSYVCPEGAYTSDAVGSADNVGRASRARRVSRRAAVRADRLD